MATQVNIDAILGESFVEKNLNTGLKTPANTIPKRIVAKKGAINLPMSKIEIQNSARKKKNTAR